MGGTCDTQGKKINEYRVLVAGLERRRPLGRPRPGWMILKWILNDVAFTEFILLRIWTSSGQL
jgi:hypothetical protein